MSKEEELNLEEPEIIYIPDEEGNEEEFEVIMKFEVETGQFAGNKYMMVVPVEVDEEDEETDEVYAFRYEEDGDDLQLYTIDNEEEWNEVEETFNTLVAESEQEEQA
ncbi:DUF1292 domain-containing protein [Paenibacillus mesophilus]|uniref:DUF1292 domain-containing protein n=1 Tax=Paenibacillus mesophilus TaxID=2582849 RepID=UPI00110F12F5|nr:DUF1292 domain-containing protein [Paenibacillus mesophilus]TMV52727.1 DUF1292 domain-containing protein [Paenibacillus mesophilus]